MPKLREELQFTSLESVIRPKEGASLYYKNGVMKLLHANGEEESLFTGTGSIDLSQYYTKTEVDNLLSELSPNGFEVIIVEGNLPETGDSGKLYLLKNEGKDTYTEYLYVNSKWEIVGSTDIDLSGYALKNEIPQNLSDLNDDVGYATNAQLETKANTSDVYTKQEVSSLVNGKANASDVYTKNEVYNKTEVNTLLSENTGGTTVIANPVLDGGEAILESVQIEDTKYSLQGQNMTFSETSSTSESAKTLKTIIIDSDEWKVESGSIVTPNVQLTGTEEVLASVDIDGTAFTLKGEEMVFSETAVEGATVLRNIKIGEDNWAIPEGGSGGSNITIRDWTV